MTLSGLSEEQLILLAQHAKDTDAFGELVKRHQAALRAFLIRLCGNLSQADDLSQISLLKAYLAINSYKAQAAFRSWLFQIAYREFLQSKRKDSLLGRLLTTLKLNHPDSTIPDFDSSIDLQRSLQLQKIPERTALILCDACGMSHSEAATVMNAPLGSVKTYLKRGREQMRICLEEHTERKTQ